MDLDKIEVTNMISIGRLGTTLPGRKDEDELSRQGPRTTLVNGLEKLTRAKQLLTA